MYDFVREISFLPFGVFPCLLQVGFFFEPSVFSLSQLHLLYAFVYMLRGDGSHKISGVAFLQHGISGLKFWGLQPKLPATLPI